MSRGETDVLIKRYTSPWLNEHKTNYPAVVTSSPKMDEQLLEHNSLRVLRPSTLELLSARLNRRKCLTTEAGKLRDWRGLVEPAGLTFDERQRVEASPDRTRQLILIWCRKQGVSIGHLVRALEAIDRFDVTEDAKAMMIADCEAAKNVTAAVMEDDSDALTIQDLEALARGEPLVKYDVMVISSDADDERAFARHLAERLEDARIGLRVFLPERDLVAGTAQHAAEVKIIDKRCQKVLPIFSPRFLENNMNLYQSNLALFTGLVDRNRSMVIPVMFRQCDDLPLQFRSLSKLPYKPDSYFWKRLFPASGFRGAVPADLMEFVFPSGFASETPTSYHLPAAQTPTLPHASFSTDTTMTNLSDVSSVNLNTTSTVLTTTDSAAFLLPTPPTHEPGGSSERRTRSGGFINGLKKSIGKKISKKKAEPTQAQ